MPARPASDELAHYRYVALNAIALAHELCTPLEQLALALEVELASDTPGADEHAVTRQALREMLVACEQVSAMTRGFLALVHTDS